MVPLRRMGLARWLAPALAAAMVGALGLTACVADGAARPPSSAPGPAQLSSEVLRQQDPAMLARLVNDYRAQRGLPRVPVSLLLSKVAQAHVDAMAAAPERGLALLRQRDPASGQLCNPHSWPAGGRWSAVCYVEDGRYAQAMFAKPREITHGAYNDIGFEIGAWDNFGILPKGALDWWKQSPPHNAVILEQGPWKDAHWQAMGVAIGDDFAYVWFGKLADPG